eukprot:TRINITY_DN14997_c0_g1_i3.p3 TRINITY_DN14997_c0_g1~~TRINITY_DN14997_c0_g1_i3.p3  ORF type:complete len:182 (-),score=15.49 TRINITY_DN14997_c0_g1_i3:438-941(-)
MAVPSSSTINKFFNDEACACAEIRVKTPYLLEYVGFFRRENSKRKRENKEREAAREEWETGEMEAQDLRSKDYWAGPFPGAMSATAPPTASIVAATGLHVQETLKQAATEERAKKQARLQKATSQGAFETTDQFWARQNDKRCIIMEERQRIWSAYSAELRELGLRK